MMNKFRWLLLPLAVLYGLVVMIRNMFFDCELFEQKKFSSNLIGVGNLSMGGTGKSIVVDFLIKKFYQKTNLSVLSRGYKRKSRGYILATSKDTPQTIGDEPFQFLSKYPDIGVAVSENRIKGVRSLENLDNQTIILDDVFQHRWVKPSVLILTTTYQRPYFSDFVFPVGRLREFALGAKRAQIILVTKCPPDLSESDKFDFLQKISPKSYQQVFFTKLVYDHKVLDYQKREYPLKKFKGKKILLVTGIVDPQPLVEYFENQQLTFQLMQFPDHHRYHSEDFNRISSTDYLVFTTEKDFYKLIDIIDPNRLYYVPVGLKFFDSNQEKEFLKGINISN